MADSPRRTGSPGAVDKRRQDPSWPLPEASGARTCHGLATSTGSSGVREFHSEDIWGLSVVNQTGRPGALGVPYWKLWRATPAAGTLAHQPPHTSEAAPHAPPPRERPIFAGAPGTS